MNKQTQAYLSAFKDYSPRNRTSRWCSGKEYASWWKRCWRLRFDSWVGKILWRRKWQPSPVFLSGKPHGQRSLEGDSPWGHRARHDQAHTRTHPDTAEHVARMKFHELRSLFPSHLHKANLVLHFTLLPFTDVAYFKKLKVCGSPEPRKSFGTIFFPKSICSLCEQGVTLRHILVILATFQSFLLSSFVLWWLWSVMVNVF